MRKNVSAITLKNYLSDFRHFEGWLLQKYPQIESDDMLASVINSELISGYKERLVTDGLPHKSVNRRLSTVRKFCSFCISQGWMHDNPAKRISNVAMEIQIEPNILAQYKSYLAKKGFNNNEIDKLYTDVSEIIN